MNLHMTTKNKNYDRNYITISLLFFLFDYFCHENGFYCIITKTRLFKYIENFTSKNLKNFQIKNSHIFHIFAENIDCWYSLEPPRRGGSNPPRRGGSNEYHQSMFLCRNKKNDVNPSFTILKVGFMAVKII